MSTALYTHPSFWQHAMGAGHPECPERLDAIDEALRATGLMEALTVVKARSASWEELRLAHDPAYLTEVRERLSRLTGTVQLDPDTAANPSTLNAALHAAGAALQATEQVLEGRFRNAFCAVRPPGHHATRRKAMGRIGNSNAPQSPTTRPQPAKTGRLRQ